MQYLTNSVAIQKIRDIQKSEGYYPCFKTEKLYCAFSEMCCWSEICLNECSVKAQHIFKVVE